jgi:hypothetical protein
MDPDRADGRWPVHRAPVRARWQSPHVQRTKGSALIEVLTTARNVLVACRPTSGTTVRRHRPTPRRQAQHPRSTVLAQSLSKIVYRSPAGPLPAGLAKPQWLAHIDPNDACISSSQPPFAEVLRRSVESAQYAAASRLKHYFLWDTGRPVKPGDDTGGTTAPGARSCGSAGSSAACAMTSRRHRHAAFHECAA